MEVSIDEDSSSSSRVESLEAIKGGGGSIKVGTTGTINALMTRELQSIKVASPAKTLRSPKAALQPNDGAKYTKPKADEASTSSSSSSSNTMNEKHKTKHHHTRKGSRNPILHHSDSVTSVDGSGSTRKNGKKGSCMVEIVDIKCGVPDKNWTNPITNKFKKLTFSKLSETNGVK